MAAGNYDFTIEQGIDLSISIQMKNKDTKDPVDLTAWSFICTLRERFSDPSALANPTVTKTSAIDGKLEISMTNTQTAVLPAGKTLVYDLEATRGDAKKIRIIQGKAYVSPEVTK